MGGIERGKQNPSLLVMARIADALGGPADEALKRLTIVNFAQTAAQLPGALNFFAGIYL
jgi:hypothetical protein